MKYAVCIKQSMLVFRSKHILHKNFTFLAVRQLIHAQWHMQLCVQMFLNLWLILTYMLYKHEFSCSISIFILFIAKKKKRKLVLLS